LARDPARAKLIFISLPHTAKSCASECRHESVVYAEKGVHIEPWLSAG